MLTDKQAAFVKEIALTGNGTQSAIKAGYSAKTAYQKRTSSVASLLSKTKLAG